ncbi:Nuclease [Bienertia sinuspersici]
MVNFDTTKSSRGNFLVVRNESNGSHKLTFPTFSPITGVFVEDWLPSYYPPHLKNWTTGETKPILCSSHHETCIEVKSLDTLHSRLSRKETCWTSNACYGIEFSYISHYWEWMEDIIPLWHITSNSKSSYVTFEEWCAFGFEVLKKYSTTSLPQVLKDFSSLGTSKPLNDSVHEAFVILDIPEEHRMDTYLAAFLTCWICAYVLPLKDLGCIRPSVFKPASQLASGRKISLVYLSFTPAKQVEHFPAHYVYAWLARYF